MSHYVHYVCLQSQLMAEDSGSWSKTQEVSGLSKRSFWKTVVLSPAKTGGFDENWRKFRYCILPTKTRDFAPRTPEIDENDENGGCHPSKMTVCQKHRFDNPESCSGFIEGEGAPEQGP